MRMAVICPSRGRPDKAKEAHASFMETKRDIGTDLIFVVDHDDETKLQYENTVAIVENSEGMGNALNVAARTLAKEYDYLGFIGDDHRFRTENWDGLITDHLAKEGGGIAYCNDLLQGVNLPTQVFMDSVIVKTLDWMALPGARHLYLDDAWKSLGEGLDRLFYFPQIIIEHLHPAAGKAEWDDNYKRVNSQLVYQHDQAIFIDWRDTQYVVDIANLRAVFEHHGDGGGVE